METRAVRCPGFYLPGNERLKSEEYCDRTKRCAEEPNKQPAQLTVSPGVVRVDWLFNSPRRSFEPGLHQSLLDGSNIVGIVQLTQRERWRRDIDDRDRHPGREEPKLL